MSESAIKIIDVVKSYSNVRAVNSVNVDIPAGCIYGFLGPNGAGKTTLIRMIMDIISPDSGRIEILGNCSGKTARDKIGYMPEERGLYRKMTVEGILDYLGALKGMSSSELKIEIPRWLKRVQIEQKQKSKLEELSRGMQQKIQFLAAVISSPDILILDEPFSGLDPVNLDLIQNLIIEMKNKGKTLVISTHIMEQAEKLCDYFMLINKGNVIFNGTLETVQAKFPINAVVLEIEGDISLIESMPEVKSVALAGKKVEAVLAPNADPQHILKTLLLQTKVFSFEIKKPTLHEIFIRSVNEDEKNT